MTLMADSAPMPISAFIGESQFASTTTSTLVSSGGVSSCRCSLRTTHLSRLFQRYSKQSVIEPFKSIKFCKIAKCNHYREQLCQIFGQEWQHWLISLIFRQEGVEGPRNCLEELQLSNYERIPLCGHNGIIQCQDLRPSFSSQHPHRSVALTTPQ